MNKKQFFLSMSKKQLISSVAVMSMLMSSAPVNVHALAIEDIIKPNNQSQSISKNENFDESCGFRVINSAHTEDTDKNPVHFVKGYRDFRISSTDRPETEMFLEGYKPKVEFHSDKQKHTYPVVTIRTGYPNNTFTVNVNRYGTDQEVKNADDYAMYNVDVQVLSPKDNKPYDTLKVTVTTEEGAYLGELDSGYKNVVVQHYKDGKTTYTFSYYLGNASSNEEHPINIHVDKRKVAVSDAESLMNALQNCSVDNIVLSNDIKFNKEKVQELQRNYKGVVSLDSKGNLIINRTVNIDGKGHFIDFDKAGCITVAGSNSKLENVTIQNYVDTGLQVYRAKNVTLDGVRTIGDNCENKYGIFINESTNVSMNNCIAQENGKYGIIANNSKVSINKCSTKKNKSCGIYVYNKDKKNEINSYVEIIDNISNIQEKNKIMIKNLNIENNSVEGNTSTQQDNKVIIKGKDITTMSGEQLKQTFNLTKIDKNGSDGKTLVYQ